MNKKLSRRNFVKSMGFTAIIAASSCSTSELQKGKNMQNTQQPISTPLLHHVALFAMDVDATLRFYIEGLGFTRRYEWNEAKATLPTGDVTFARRGVYLDTGNGTYIEIFPGGRVNADSSAGRLQHFALRVTNTEVAYRRALAAGARSYSFDVKPTPWNGEPTVFTHNGNPPFQARIAFLMGLDGELIEFYELLSQIETK